MTVWLVLSDDGDPVGPWLVEGLTHRGLGPVLHLTTGDLLGSATWSHTVGNDGAGFTALLADGTELDSRNVSGVVNRIGFIPPTYTAPMVEADREYVLHELNAFFLSWLNSIDSPILNPPSSRGLAGAWRPASEWASLAARAGLGHMPLTSTDTDPNLYWSDGSLSHRTAITVDGEIVDDGLDEETRQACLRLADLAKTPLLGIEFIVGDGGDLMFASANPQPRLPVAGEAIIDAIVYVMNRSAA